MSHGDHRPSRPRPPNLHLESSSNLYRLEGPRSNNRSFIQAPLAPPVNYRKQRQHQQLTTTTPLQSPQTMAFNQSLTLSALTAPHSSYLPMYGVEAPTTNGTIDESSCGSSTSSIADIYGDVQVQAMPMSVGREEWERGGGGDCSQSTEGISISWYVSSFPSSVLGVSFPPVFFFEKRLDKRTLPSSSFLFFHSPPPAAASPTFDLMLVAPDPGVHAAHGHAGGDSSSYRALVHGHLPMETTAPTQQLQHALHTIGPDNNTMAWDNVPVPDFNVQQYTGSDASHHRGLEIPSSVRAAHGVSSMHQHHFAAHLEYPMDSQL